MSIFRPSNINKRLVGTPNYNTNNNPQNRPIPSGIGSSFGSPKNGNVIGPIKTPYLVRLGCRCMNGCCAGIFSLNESRCGVRECCYCAISADCKGNFYCCGIGCDQGIGITTGTIYKWFVAPKCAEVRHTATGPPFPAVTCANSVLGCCGWYLGQVPSFTSSGYDGYNALRYCNIYWDNPVTNEYYWSSAQYSGGYWSSNASGSVLLGYGGYCFYGRAIRRV
jgi:hypothetical protein